LVGKHVIECHSSTLAIHVEHGKKGKGRPSAYIHHASYLIQRSGLHMSRIDDLERLATLFEKGLLSEEEFARQKASCLQVDGQQSPLSSRGAAQIRYLEIGLCILITIGFFLPWFNFGFLGTASGYEIPGKMFSVVSAIDSFNRALGSRNLPTGVETAEVQLQFLLMRLYLYSIPCAAVLSIIASLFAWRRGVYNLIAGALPLAIPLKGVFDGKALHLAGLEFGAWVTFPSALLLLMLALVEVDTLTEVSDRDNKPCPRISTTALKTLLFLCVLFVIFCLIPLITKGGRSCTSENCVGPTKATEKIALAPAATTAHRDFSIPDQRAAAVPAGWSGTYTYNDPTDEGQPTYTLAIDGPIRDRFDGTLSVEGIQIFYRLRVRAYDMPNGLQVMCMGTEEGAPPWTWGAYNEPDINVPLFTIRRVGTSLHTAVGTWPGGPTKPSFNKTSAN
jgi:hypothetical protein